VELTVSDISVQPPPATELVLVQALPKLKAMEVVLEKSVELGVGRIVPFVSARSVARAGAEDAPARFDRWNRIVEGAGKQSGASRFPVLDPLCDASGAATRVAELDIALVGSLETHSPPMAEVLASCLSHPSSAGIVIGPEGDLTPEEINLFRGAGGRPVSLGSLVLRVETAATLAMGIMGFWFGTGGPGSAQHR
jgi:16S rRNA (uracil1498-N3)-methyltransferase